jgi:hypothetical protein
LRSSVVALCGMWDTKICRNNYFHVLTIGNFFAYKNIFTNLKKAGKLCGSSTDAIPFYKIILKFRLRSSRDFPEKRGILPWSDIEFNIGDLVVTSSIQFNDFLFPRISVCDRKNISWIQNEIQYKFASQKTASAINIKKDLKTAAIIV